jgi:hypothetical protein
LLRQKHLKSWIKNTLLNQNAKKSKWTSAD